MLPLITEWFIILNKKKEKGNHTARPRTIKLEQGTVYLQDFSPEVAEQLTAHINKFSSDTMIQEESKSDTPTATTFEFTKKAVGVSLNSTTNRMQVVTVAYDVDSKAAEVVSVYDADGGSDATNKFKMVSVELGFIR